MIERNRIFNDAKLLEAAGIFSVVLECVETNLAKKISKPSKVFSSGVKQGKTELNQKARKEKFSRLRKSGSTKDATSIFLDMINNQ